MPRIPKGTEVNLLRLMATGSQLLVEYEGDGFFLYILGKDGSVSTPHRKWKAGGAFWGMSKSTKWIEKTDEDEYFRDVFSITQAGREALALCV